MRAHLALLFFLLAVNVQAIEEQSWLKKTLKKPFSRRSSSRSSLQADTTPPIEKETADGVTSRDYASSTPKSAESQKSNQELVRHYMQLYAKQYGLSGHKELDALASMEETGRRSSMPLNAPFSHYQTRKKSGRATFSTQSSPYSANSLSSSTQYLDVPNRHEAASLSTSASYSPASTPSSPSPNAFRNPFGQSNAASPKVIVTPPADNDSDEDSDEERDAREPFDVAALRRALKGKARMSDTEDLARSRETIRQAMEQKSRFSSVDSLDAWLAQHLAEEEGNEDAVKYTRLDANHEPIPR